VAGFEPTASGFGDRCSTRLSYTPTSSTSPSNGKSLPVLRLEATPSRRSTLIVRGPMGHIKPAL
jgi:hypothetical protein